MTRVSDQKVDVEDVVIARIVKARGLRGEVACDIETAFPERFESLEQVTVWMPDNSRRSLVVEDAWFHKERVILKFTDYDTMTAASQLVGGRLVISEADALPLETDEFFEYQLVGLEVVTVSGVRIGRVSRLLRTGATDILVIHDDDRRERLVPFVDEICPEVDVESGRIIIAPPEGLLDL